MENSSTPGAGPGRDELVSLTGDIVAAYLSHNPTPLGELPSVISAVHAALARLGRSDEMQGPGEPAVPIKRSVRRDAVACLECGKWNKMLRRHLSAMHGVTPAEYRARWGLPRDYPMTAPSYTEQRSELAKAAGLGRRRREPEPPPTPPPPAPVKRGRARKSAEG